MLCCLCVLWFMFRFFFRFPDVFSNRTCKNKMTRIHSKQGTLPFNICSMGADGGMASKRQLSGGSHNRSASPSKRAPIHDDPPIRKTFRSVRNYPSSKNRGSRLLTGFDLEKSNSASLTFALENQRGSILYEDNPAGLELRSLISSCKRRSGDWRRVQEFAASEFL